MPAARTPDAAAAAMLTRPIPATGEQLPVIGCGTYKGFDAGPRSAGYKHLPAVVSTLVETGGALLDSSPMYGRAEQTVGEVLASTGLGGRLFLATKVWTHGRHEGLAQMEQSFERLQTRRIDLMQIHNLTDWRTHLPTLRGWKDAGRLRYIGVTHSQDQAQANDRLIEIMRHEKLDFMQVNYSMAERSVEQRLLAAAAETGTAVLVNLPFARGRLFAAVRGRPMPEWAAEFDASSWGQFFLKYMLASEAVTCVLPGTDKPEYMVDNLDAGRTRLPNAAMRRKMVEFVSSVG
jgi:aryl-alcohol dehydrogenase-like predicted oxidoreductase